MSVHNEALKSYQEGNLPEAVELFRQALTENPSPGMTMVIKMHLALCVWQQAGLELEGKVYTMNEHRASAAEEAMHLWEDVVNIYNKEVQNDPEELRRWPLPGATALELKKDASGAAFRAYSALQRVRDNSPAETVSQSPSAEKKSGGCFIATAAFGSPLAPEVLVFRRYRDEVLLASRVGRIFVNAYYAASPPFALFISKHGFLRTVIRSVLLQPVSRLLKK